MKKHYIISAFLVVLGTTIVAGALFYYLNLKETDKSLFNVKQKGVLIVGSDIPYGRMELFDENDQPVGIDVDVAKELAKHLGVSLQFKDYSWDELFSKVKNGEIDLAISSITITPERRQDILFSNPYFNGGQVLVTLKENSDIEGVGSLSGKSVGVQEETTGSIEAQKYIASSSIFYYPSFDTLLDGSGILTDLRNKKFDAIIVDYVQALDLIKNNTDLKIVGIPFTKEEYGIATKIGNNLLIHEVDKILNEMVEDGHLQAIKTKWLRY